MTRIFLHGLGQTPSVWQPMLHRLEPELPVYCPSLVELAGENPRYPDLLHALEESLAEVPGPLHLCGLSLGGVLALDYALHHQERVASLVLCATPLTIPRNLLRLQDFLFRLMPERAFAGSGFSREAMRQLAGSVAELDLRPPAAGAGLSGAGALRQQGPCQPQGRPGTGRTTAPGPAALDHRCGA